LLQPLPRLRSRQLRWDSLVKRVFRLQAQSSLNPTRTPSNRRLSLRRSSPLFVTNRESDSEAVHIVDREETFRMSSNVESNTEIEQLGYEDTNYSAGMSRDIEMQQEAEILVVELAED
jgi:hypothetical protein